MLPPHQKLIKDEKFREEERNAAGTSELGGGGR